MSRDSTTQTTEGRENDPPWSFEELVRVTLDVLGRDHPDDFREVPAGALERLRAGRATLADVDAICRGLGWTRNNLLSVLSHIEQRASVVMEPDDETPRIDHHLSPARLLAIQEQEYPPGLVLRAAIDHMVRLCPHCADVWDATLTQRLQPMGLIRSELRGRRNDKAAKARRAVGRLTELDAEGLAGGLRKIGRGGRNVYLVELLRQASWRTADPALARARAKAAAAVLREVIPPGDQMALRELLDTLSVACLVALARGHRRDGGIRRAGGLLEIARARLLDCGVHDLRTVTELDSEHGQILWARLDHERAFRLLERCSLDWLYLGELDVSRDLTLLMVELRLDQGDADAAAERLRFTERFDDLPPWRTALLAARTAVLGGDLAGAEAHLDRWLREEPAPADGEPESVVARRAAVLFERGRIEFRWESAGAAAETLVQARTAARAAGLPLLEARCGLALWQAWSHGGRIDEARGALRDAREVEGLPAAAPDALAFFDNPPAAVSGEEIREVDRFLDRLERNPELAWEAPS